MKRRLPAVLIATVLFVLISVPVSSQAQRHEFAVSSEVEQESEHEVESTPGPGEIEETDQAIADLNQRLDDLEGIAGNGVGTAGAGGVAFLFGAFCALWAQNTGRNAWLWFFLGMFFTVITVLALLVRNSDDLRSRKTGVRSE